MEKFCIVKRRKKNTEIDTAIVNGSANLLNSFFKDGNNVQKTNHIGENKESIINFSLTPEQGNIIKSSNHFSSILNGTVSGYDLTVDNDEDGRIILNLNFGKIENLNLLKPKQVCKMLQVSRYFLRKLAKQKKITSFKIGSLRRFALKDVLDFISKSKDVYTRDGIVI